MRELGVQAQSTVFEAPKPYADTGHEQRRHVRYKADHSVIFIAPTRKYGEVPPLSSFFPVRCRDLSRGGVSFLFPKDPGFTTLVVQLGNEHGCIYMEAEVVHFCALNDIPSKPAWDIYGREYENRFGPSAVKVGCQFLKRIAAPMR